MKKNEATKFPFIRHHEEGRKVRELFKTINKLYKFPVPSSKLSDIFPAGKEILITLGARENL
jgi:hypothetical protein